MERKSHLTTGLFALIIAALLTSPGTLAALPQFHYHPAPPLPLSVETEAPPAPNIPEEYRQDKPQPLMRGDGFNYNLYYNYRLTPHVILRPNLQQTTKPGAVSDASHLFVGGLSAGINF